MKGRKIKFHKAFISGKEESNIKKLTSSPELFGSRIWLKKCEEWFKKHYTSNAVFFSSSCTAALEMACLAEDVGKDDEIIMPSYTYVSTANAFAKQGARPVFVDISPGDMNIDATNIEGAITSKTRAVVAVHYAGVSCNMDAITKICSKYNLILIEDAAHGFGAFHKNKLLGTSGDYGAISFDHTKNIHCSQGGVLLVNNKSKLEKIKHIYENGTNKNEFLAHKVPYFEWVEKGSKFPLSEMNAAFLFAQLNNSKQVLKKRTELWNYYFNSLKHVGRIYFELPVIPAYAKHNAHVFYIRLRDKKTRDELQQYLNKNGIESVFHFIPLHSSRYGKKVGRFNGKDIYTTTESGKLLRLPLHTYLNKNDIDFVVSCIRKFFGI